MAQLPTIRDNGVTIAGARSRVTPQDIANPYQQVADVLGDAANMFKAKEIDDAGIAGENAVYRDPDGQLQVTMRNNLSQTGRTYNRAAQQAFMARLSGDVRKNGAELATEAKGDPERFNSLFKGFRDTAIAGTPRELRGAVTTLLDSEGARFGLGVSEAKRGRDLKVFEGNIKAEIQSLDDEMAALAQKGGVSTDAYRERQARIQTLTGEMVANPEFALGAQEAEIAMKRMESRHMGFALVGKVEAVLQGQGVVAARKMADSVLTDEALGLSPSERRSFSSMMDERINGALAVRKAALEPVKLQATSIKERLKLGVGLDADDVDVTAKQLAAGGDLAGAMDLISARGTARSLADFRGKSSAEQVEILAQAKKGAISSGASGATQVRAPAAVRSAISNAAARHGVSANALMKIAQIESSMNPKAKNPNSSAGGLFQQIDSNAREYGVADRFDASQSADGAARFMKDNANHLHKVLGREPTDGELYLAHQQGPGGAADLLANPDAMAVDVISPEAVRLNGGNAGMTARQFAAKWINKVDGGSSVSYEGIDPELVKEYQSEITSDAKSLLADMQAGAAKSAPPSIEDVSMLTRQLSMIDDADFKSQVQTFFESEAASSMLAELPGAEREALIASLRSDAAGGSSVAQQEMLFAMERTHEAATKALNEAPIGYAVTRGLSAAPEPLNFQGGAAALAPAFQQRQQAVDALQARGLRDDAPALEGEDLKALKAYMARATPEEAIGVLHVMGQSLSPQTMQTTAAALAGKDGAQGMAMAGALYNDNPEVAESVLRGSQLLAINPKLAAKDDDTYRNAVMEGLPSRVFASGMEKGRQDILDAARARYADLSAQSGDESGVLSEDRFTRAINEVTGGFVAHNGEDIIAPRYGMNQTDFDAMLTKNGAALLSGAVTAEGEPVTLENLMQEARLRAVGNGEYIIEFGSHTGYPTYARAASDRLSRDGGIEPFILDMRP